MIIERIKELIAGQPVGKQVTVAGWVRTRRDSGSFSFIEVNDGSTLANIQVIGERTLTNYEDEIKRLTTGCSVVITGELKESPAKGQAVEVLADVVSVVGWADPESYPLQKKRHTFEYLREISHLRPRTNALGAVARIRSQLTHGVHHFFRQRGVFSISIPRSSPPATVKGPARCSGS